MASSMILSCPSPSTHSAPHIEPRATPPLRCLCLDSVWYSFAQRIRMDYAVLQHAELDPSSRHLIRDTVPFSGPLLAPLWWGRDLTQETPHSSLFYPGTKTEVVMDLAHLYKGQEEGRVNRGDVGNGLPDEKSIAPPLRFRLLPTPRRALSQASR